MSLARPFHALILFEKNNCPLAYHMDQRCNQYGETFVNDFSWYAHQPFLDMNVRMCYHIQIVDNFVNED